jgi:aspartyl/asparaginyl beta-hydroxylase (cupin superfamily)
MFLDVERFPFADALRAATSELREEFLQVYGGRFTAWPAQGAFRGDWSVLPIINRGTPGVYPELRRLCRRNQPAFPRLNERIKMIPGLLQAGFSRLSPGTEVGFHFDEDRPGIYRCHLGLIVPDGCDLRTRDDRREHAEGRLVAFHGAVEHAASNPSQEERVTLMVDVLRSAYRSCGYSEEQSV